MSKPIDSTHTTLWVGRWNNRHIVFDPTIQPKDKKFILLYFVQGKSLCLRDRVVERKRAKTVRSPYEIDFALKQYRKWLSINSNNLQERTYQCMSIEAPPPPRRKCSQCDGHGNWHYTVGTFSEGAHSDGQNMTEYCTLCGGHGFIDDVFEL